MGLWDDWSSKIVDNPEWEVIRSELCVDESLDPVPRMVNLGDGLRFWYGECTWTPEQRAKEELFTKICWYVNNGPGYCEEAPEHIKVYLRRLGLKV